MGYFLVFYVIIWFCNFSSPPLPGVTHLFQTTGWIKDAEWRTWVDEILSPVCKGKFVLLILDSATTHVSRPNLDHVRRKTGCDIAVIPGKMTPFVQYLDVYGFAPFKTAFHTALENEKDKHKLQCDSSRRQDIRFSDRFYREAMSQCIATAWPVVESVDRDEVAKRLVTLGYCLKVSGEEDHLVSVPAFPTLSFCAAPKKLHPTLKALDFLRQVGMSVAQEATTPELAGVPQLTRFFKFGLEEERAEQQEQAAPVRPALKQTRLPVFKVKSLTQTQTQTQSQTQAPTQTSSQSPEILAEKQTQKKTRKRKSPDGDSATSITKKGPVGFGKDLEPWERVKILQIPQLNALVTKHGIVLKKGDKRGEKMDAVFEAWEDVQSSVLEMELLANSKRRLRDPNFHAKNPIKDA